MKISIKKRKLTYNYYNNTTWYFFPHIILKGIMLALINPIYLNHALDVKMSSQG